MFTSCLSCLVLALTHMETVFCYMLMLPCFCRPKRATTLQRAPPLTLRTLLRSTPRRASSRSASPTTAAHSPWSHGRQLHTDCMHEAPWSARELPDNVARPLQGEGLLHRAAAAVGLASDKAQETKEAAKDQASKG
jgi:hypothetical protein